METDGICYADERAPSKPGSALPTAARRFSWRQFKTNLGNRWRT
jgi:hypothetical protein